MAEVFPGHAAALDSRLFGVASRPSARWRRVTFTPGTRCYDLGCSLGAATLAMRQGIRCEDCRIIAVDNAPAMIARCEIIAADDGSADDDVPGLVGDMR